MPPLWAKYILCKILVSDSVLRKDFYHRQCSYFILFSFEYFILFSFHNQGQSSKTLIKNQSMHSLIDNCFETPFHLLRIVLRSFTEHNTTELFLFFYYTWNIKWHSAK